MHSNHLKFLPLQSVKFLVKFYNSCIIHKHFPAAMLEGYIRPQIKDKGGCLRGSENFREVMISNNIFKVFEYALLPLLKRRVILSSHQYAYRNSTSTTMAVALSKETVGRSLIFKYYRRKCCVFLDLLKEVESSLQTNRDCLASLKCRTPCQNRHDYRLNHPPRKTRPKTTQVKAKSL